MAAQLLAAFHSRAAVAARLPAAVEAITDAGAHPGHGPGEHDAEHDRSHRLRERAAAQGAVLESQRRDHEAEFAALCQQATRAEGGSRSLATQHGDAGDGKRLSRP